MKVKIAAVYLSILFLSVFLLAEERKDGSSEDICKEISRLTLDLSSDRDVASVLLKIGRLAQKIEVGLRDYEKNSDYKNFCHLKIVKSGNFGDFVAYDGYHYKEIVKKYPDSDLADDAAYELVYVIDSDEYNYDDLNEEKRKLLKFIKKYPHSNMLHDAQERVKEIEAFLKSGGNAIFD